MKKISKKKGFTLVELLAVIVILAILIAIAVPAVTKYITKSRKEGMIQTANSFVSAISTDTVSEFYELPIGNNDVTIISVDLIKLENGKEKTPYSGHWLPKYSYVAIINVGTDEDPEYEYYIALRDSKRYTISLTNNATSSNITRSNISGTDAPITAMCGSSDGKYMVIDKIIGLEKHQPNGGWNAIVYSSQEC